MDLGAAIVTLVVGAVAVLPRIPSLSVDGRKVARLKADAELAASLPEGDARVALAEHIEVATLELLDARRRPASIDQRLSGAMVPLFMAWVAGLLVEGLPRDEKWLESVVLCLGVIALGLGSVGAILMVVVLAQALGEGWTSATTRLRRWRATRHPGRSHA